MYRSHIAHLTSVAEDWLRASKLGPRPQGGETVGPISNFEFDRGIAARWLHYRKKKYECQRLG